MGLKISRVGHHMPAMDLQGCTVGAKDAKEGSLGQRPTSHHRGGARPARRGAGAGDGCRTVAELECWVPPDREG